MFPCRPVSPRWPVLRFPIVFARVTLRCYVFQYFLLRISSHIISDHQNVCFSCEKAMILTSLRGGDLRAMFPRRPCRNLSGTTFFTIFCTANVFVQWFVILFHRHISIIISYHSTPHHITSECMLFLWKSNDFDLLRGVDLRAMFPRPPCR